VTRRGGAALLMAVIVLVMAGGAWLGLRPFLGRQTVTFSTLLPRVQAPAECDEIVRGVRLALDKNGGRAGFFRVQYDDVDVTALTGGQSVIRDESPLTRRFVLPELYRVTLPRATAVGPNLYRVPCEGTDEGELAALWAARMGTKSVYVLGENVLPPPGVLRCYPILSPLTSVVELGSVSRAYRFVVTARELRMSIAGQEDVPQDPAAYKGLLGRVARWRTDLVYADAPGR